ncbi:MAG: tryptophan-rich sensory protein [Clostridiaceae bacterium]|nr:tryptophan-rich sensory protein [Clostridiaceae bacterium]
MNSTRKLAIFNVAVFIGTVVMNVLANLLPINNLTTGEVADLYPNLFTPAGITFSIWGLIYTLLGIFTVYQLVVAFRAKEGTETFVDRIGIWNIVLGIGNMLWILVWHYTYVGISVIIMLIMLISLITIYKRLGIGRKNKPKTEVFLVHINFSVYLGWISIATIANITAFLVAIDWNGFGVSPVIWTIIVMTVGIVLGLLFIFLHRDIFYALVIDWALLGIYLKRTAEGTAAIRPIISWSIIGMIIITVAILIAILKKRVYIFKTA